MRQSSKRRGSVSHLPYVLRGGALCVAINDDASSAFAGLASSLRVSLPWEDGDQAICTGMALAVWLTSLPSIR